MLRYSQEQSAEDAGAVIGGRVLYGLRGLFGLRGLTCQRPLDENLVASAVVVLGVHEVGLACICDSGIVVGVSQVGNLDAVTSALDNLRHRVRLNTDREIVEVIRVDLTGFRDRGVVDVSNSLLDIQAFKVLVVVDIVVASLGSEGIVNAG